MSKARDLANLLADGSIGSAEIANGAVIADKLASGASLANLADGSISAAKFASGVAVANIGYTPVNKAGDTMTGALTAGGVLLGNVQEDIMALWRSADMQGYKDSYGDGGGIAYTWDNGIVRVDSSVGSHNWDVGKIRLPAGRYQVAMQYRPSPTQHGWNVYGTNSNAHLIRLQTDAGYGQFNNLITLRVQLNKDVGYSQMFLSPTYVVSADGTFRIGMQTDPYGTGGYKCYVEAAYLLRVE